MNKQIVNKEDYFFYPTDGKIVFVDELKGITQSSLLLITNVSSNKFIYNFGCEGFGGTVSNNVVILEQDTTSMNSGDELQIIYYSPSTYGDELIVSMLKEIKTQNECLNGILEQLILNNELLKSISE